MLILAPSLARSNNYPLGNYVYEFFDDCFAFDGAGTVFYPGSTLFSTYVITMVADDGSTVISSPTFHGTAGNQGKYGIWLSDYGCA